MSLRPKKKKDRPPKIVYEKVEEKNDLSITLGKDQEEALNKLRQFWNDKTQEFYLLKGFAGTGKSTLSSVFLNELPQSKIRLCATTNKAASVLREKCNEAGLNIKVTTIYKLLKLVPQQIGEQWKLRQQAEPNIKSVDLIIIDECSMVDSDLWNQLQDLPFQYSLKILLMGDPAQLPPINESSSPSFDIPFSSELSEVYRQGKGNPILAYSLEIRKALEHSSKEIPLPKASHNIHLFKSETEWKNTILHDFKTTNVTNHDNQLQILSWTNQRVNKWNKWVQQHIYPSEHGPFPENQPLILTSPVTKGGWKSPHEVVLPNNEPVKVIASRHISWRSLDLWELDLRSIDGTIVTIIYIPDPLKDDVELKLNEWRAERHNKVNGQEVINKWQQQCVGIQPASAMTIHRSQGSSFEVVYIDFVSILKCKDPQQLLQLLYVAIT